MQALTYGSADGIAGRQAQGWGVLRRAGDHDLTVEKSLLEGVSVSLPATVPTFPSAADLAARPVRFRHTPSSDPGVGYWWRSVEAGADHSQRPGNVFTHAVARRYAPGARPADLAHSPVWLSPFGADQVRDAHPSDDFTPPEDPEAVGIAAVLAWIHRSRAVTVPSVPWVVDAAIQALLAGTPVILRRVNPDDAWGWIALITWLLPARRGNRVGFSTSEDPSSLGRALEIGVHLAALPGEAPIPPLSADVRELDPSWPVDADAALVAGSWALPNGVHVPVTAWADVARDLIWLAPASAREALSHRDELMELLSEAEAQESTSGSLTLRLGLLSTPGAVIMGRREMLEAALDEGLLPPYLWSHPSIAPLVREAGFENPPAAAKGSHAVDALGESALLQRLPDTTPPQNSFVVPVCADQSGFDVTTEPVRSPEIAVTLVKNPPDLHVEDDLLDLYPHPIPASILPAAAMVSRYGSLDAILDTRQWVRLLLTFQPPGRLALLHCISQAAPVVVEEEEVVELMSSLSPDPYLDRYMSPLLLLLLRAEARGDLPEHRREERPEWQEIFRVFVLGLDPEEASYLALPYLNVVAMSDPASGPMRHLERANIRRWSYEYKSVTLWSMICSDGRSLAKVVSETLARPS